jgi:hypothetical protein
MCYNKKCSEKGALSGHVIQLSIKTLTSKFGKLINPIKKSFSVALWPFRRRRHRDISERPSRATEREQEGGRERERKVCSTTKTQQTNNNKGIPSSSSSSSSSWTPPPPVLLSFLPLLFLV